MCGLWRKVDSVTGWNGVRFKKAHYTLLISSGEKIPAHISQPTVSHFMNRIFVQGHQNQKLIIAVLWEKKKKKKINLLRLGFAMYILVMLRVNAGNIRIARFTILTSFKKFANSREHILSHSKQRYSADSERGFCLSCPVSAIRIFRIKS